MEQTETKPIIILSGPPGAGKSTITKDFVELSKGQVACIEGDKFWYFFAKGWEAMPEGKNFKTIMVAMISAAMAYARNGYETIVDFSVPPWFMPAAYKMAARRDIKLHFVVLRPDETICAARAAQRSEGAIQDYAGYKSLYESFDNAPNHIICDNDSSAASIATKIRRGVDTGIYQFSGEF